MLRISIVDGILERRWIIQGRLVGPWVSELEEAWETSGHERDERRSVVDLADLTAVDERGEKVLGAMRESGAVFVGCGLHTSQLMADIDSHCKAQSPLRPAEAAGHTPPTQSIAVPAAGARGGGEHLVAKDVGRRSRAYGSLSKKR